MEIIKTQNWGNWKVAGGKTGNENVWKKCDNKNYEIN